jgi:hypothetical protein
MNNDSLVTHTFPLAVVAVLFGAAHTDVSRQQARRRADKEVSGGSFI